MKPPENFYRAYGWKPESSINIPDDHLGTELLFLTRLKKNILRLMMNPAAGK